MGAPFTLCVIAVASVLTACAVRPDGVAPMAVDNPEDMAGDNSSEGLLRIAKDMEAHGQSEAALPLYKRSVTMSGDTPSAYVRLGDACFRAGRNAEAIDAYRAALGKAPDDAEALLGLGSALVRKGDTEAGIDALAKAAPTVKSAVAYDRLGVAQTLAGRLPEAQASFASATELAPDDLDIRTNLALAAALAGDEDKAVDTMREIIHSPTAEIRHRRNFVVVLGIAGRGQEVKSVGLEGLSDKELRSLLARAGSIRAIKSAKARAKALGAIAG